MRVLVAVALFAGLASGVAQAEAWRPLPGWFSECGVEAALEPAEVVPAIEWQPCSHAPDGVSCQAMVTNWTDSSTPIALNPRFDAVGDSEPVLMFRRVRKDRWVDLIAEIDGLPLHAFRTRPRSQAAVGCYLQAGDLQEGHFVYALRGHHAAGDAHASPYSAALVGRSHDPRTNIVSRSSDGERSGWLIGPNRLVRISVPDLAITIFQRDAERISQIATVGAGSDPQQLTPGQFVVAGENVFWGATSARKQRLRVWSPAHGVQELFADPGELLRDAADLGTDGRDLVWSIGAGPEASIVTASSAENPATLQPRRLRSRPYASSGNHRFVVACGMAAHGDGVGGLTVVRLQDGHAWHVEALRPGFVMERPIGLTCDELVAIGEIDGRTTIVRLGIGSFGMRSAAD